MLLSDNEILSRCVTPELFGLKAPMISPFVIGSVNVNEHGQKISSYGFSSYGYDSQLGNVFKTLKPRTKPLLLYGDNNDVEYEDHVIGTEPDDAFILTAKTFALGVSHEEICMPRDCTVICMAKSTLARANLQVVVTPLEAGWNGHITFEIFNNNDFDICLKPGMGICQLLFLKGNSECTTSYADRNNGTGGKYQNQPKLPVAYR